MIMSRKAKYETRDNKYQYSVVIVIKLHVNCISLIDYTIEQDVYLRYSSEIETPRNG